MIAIDLPKYQYQTLSQTKHMTFEYPQGNAHQGAAFGEKKAPMAAIGAFSAISAGAVTSGILGGLLIAGGALGLVGAVTGNKTLMAIGSVAGIAGGFVTPAGGFNNPFTDGLGGSSAAKGFSKVFDGIKSSLGIDTSGAAGQITGGIETAAGANGAVAEGVKSAAANGGLVVNGTSAINAGTSAASAAGGGSSLLKTLAGSKDLMGMISGAAEGYQEQPLVEARTDQLEAQTANTERATQLTNDRYNNKQFQDTGNIATANSDAEIRSSGSPTEGKFAVVVGNEVKYVTSSEYEQLRAQQQSAPAPAAGGMVNAGAA